MTTLKAHRTPAVLIALVVAAGAFVPAGTALHGLSLLGIGSFLLGADGSIEGANVVGSLDASSGTLTDFALRGATYASAMPVFEVVTIDGFQGAAPIDGAGSAALRLVGSNAILTTADAASTPLLIQATQATSVAYALAPDLTAQTTALPGVLSVTDAHGALVGQLVHVPAAGAAAADALHLAEPGRVVVDLSTHESVAFHGVPDHLAGSDHLAAVVGLASTGLLAHEFVSDFHGTGLKHVGVDFLAGGVARSRLVGDQAIETAVSGSASGAASRVVSYDLDYEVLAAQAPSDVAVYVDGALAPVLGSADEFAARAAAGASGYHAAIAEGRTLVLAALPAAGHHLVTLANVAASGGNPPALAAQALSSKGGHAPASLAVLGDLGDPSAAEAVLLGRFVSASVTQAGGSLALGHVTDLASRTQLLESIRFVSDGVGVSRESAAAVALTTSTAQVVVRDGPAGVGAVAVTDLVEGPSVQRVVLELASGVTSTAESSQLVRLDGPSGFVGWIVAAAGPQPTSWARLIAGGAGPDIAAELGEGATLLVIPAADDGATATAAVHALAARGLGSFAAFSVSGQGVTSAVSDHLGNDAAHLAVVHAALGVVELTYHASATGARATSFLAIVEGAMPAQAAKDVRVMVDGAEALPAASADAALAAATPSYFVDTSGEGLLMLVNAASQARAPAGADVTILSKLVSAASAHASDDLFGAFSVLSDGSAVGKYVQARADTAAGILHDYTVTAPAGAAVVFDAIRVGGDGFASPGASGTHRLTLADSGATITLTDQTAAVLSVAAESARRVTFVPSPGVEVQRLAPDVVTLAGPNGLVGALMLADVSGVAGGSGELLLQMPAGVDPATAVRGLDPINVDAALQRGDQVIFRAFSGLEAELDDVQRVALARAIAAGDVGGQVIVQQAPEATGLGVPALAALDATTSFQTSLDILTAATADSVTVTLSSAVERGRTVLLSLDGDTVPGLASGDAEILFDGAPMARASSYADVLAPLDDGGVAEYWILTSTVTGASQVLVSVPSFSVHTVTLKESAEEESDLFLWVSLGLGVVVVAQGVLLVRMRRRAF